MRFADVGGCCGGLLSSEQKPADFELGRLPNFEQGPDQGPSSPIKYYPGIGYAPDGHA